MSNKRFKSLSGQGVHGDDWTFLEDVTVNGTLTADNGDITLTRSTQPGLDLASMSVQSALDMQSNDLTNGGTVSCTEVNAPTVNATTVMNSPTVNATGHLAATAVRCNDYRTLGGSLPLFSWNSSPDEIQAHRNLNLGTNAMAGGSATFSGTVQTVNARANNYGNTSGTNILTWDSTNGFQLQAGLACNGQSILNANIVACSRLWADELRDPNGSRLLTFNNSQGDWYASSDISGAGSQKLEAWAAFNDVSASALSNIATLDQSLAKSDDVNFKTVSADNVGAFRNGTFGATTGAIFESAQSMTFHYTIVADRCTIFIPYVVGDAGGIATTDFTLLNAVPVEARPAESNPIIQRGLIAINGDPSSTTDDGAVEVGTGVYAGNLTIHNYDQWNRSGFAGINGWNGTSVTYRV